MDKTQKFESAWAWARDARIAALRQKREHLAAPRNPFKARPGMEADFERVNRDILALDTILGMIEDAHALERMKETRSKATRLRNLITDFIFGFGMAALQSLGLAAVCITVKAPDPIVQATAIIGVGYSLARSVKIAWK